MLTKDDLKSIQNVVKEEVRSSIKDEVRPIVRNEIQTQLKKALKPVKDHLDKIDRDLESVHRMVRNDFGRIQDLHERTCNIEEHLRFPSSTS
ncbi:MAG: hypothetical protein AAB929_04455 [Patescibacteria group bacterium]